MHKRGSLQLSINAIVVLILAITMLGLGLAFMRGTFSSVTEQFKGISEEVKKDMLDRLKESPEELVLSVYKIEIRPGEETSVFLAIRNDLDNETTFFIDENDTSNQPCGTTVETTDCCIAMGGGDCRDLSLESFPRITLGAGESDVLELVISADPRADIDTYRMPIRVNNAPGSLVEFDKTVVLNVEVR